MAERQRELLLPFLKPFYDAVIPLSWAICLFTRFFAAAVAIEWTI
jgi:hypothetical protein